jgi:hypothetical protein
MSAAPIDPNDVSSGIKDGLLASILGGMAMVARLLLSHEPVTFPWVVRRVAAAAIVAVIVGFSIEGQIHTPGLRMAVIGASGYCAPEGLDYLLKYVKAKGEAELNKVKGTKRAKRKTK